MKYEEYRTSIEKFLKLYLKNYNLIIVRARNKRTFHILIVEIVKKTSERILYEKCAISYPSYQKYTEENPDISHVLQSAISDMFSLRMEHGYLNQTELSKLIHSIISPKINAILKNNNIDLSKYPNRTTLYNLVSTTPNLEDFHFYRSVSIKYSIITKLF